jgi:hypothetical protein
MNSCNNQMHFVRNNDTITLTRNGPGRFMGSFKIDRTIMEIWDERKSGKVPNESPKNHYNVSVLKSNLQKAVRRHNSAAAHATLQQLALQDPVEATRRSPIIMCEDTQLCPELFAELVWLMAAVSKGYNLTEQDLQIMHNALETMLEAPGRYNLRVDVDDSELKIRDAVTEAFAIRIAFGGMKGDMRFLGFLERRYAACELPCVSAKTYTQILESFHPQKHILPQAIDFHCFPKLLREIDGLTQESVWWHWSSYNVREFTGIGANADKKHEEQQRQAHPLCEKDAVMAYALHKIRWVQTTATVVKLTQQRLDAMFVVKKI